eukprot:gnl/TRDRNA2_/TRDRNA2_186301_c0_seq1.p1 gnl/TRDRNA2_/TRDRNA2_186301_c0~~gnl/TRDRNA2_/TRDRNA2_186301_c0_seq1.p1  ORF type:complete len:266 (-),score=38.43 gnl/TRDRNA2_/TRDRNA2_186301_c0_seq1:125-922(-)
MLHPEEALLRPDASELIQEAQAGYPLLLPKAEDGECHLLGDSIGYLVQMLLFTVCMCSLLIKWRIESPPRTLKVFFLDTSKQICSSCWLHGLNLLIAMRLRRRADTAGDECSWYWINLMADTTFGLVVVYSTLRLSEKLFGYQSGNYRVNVGPDQELQVDYSKWFRQIVLYLAIVSVKKTAVVLLIWLLLPHSMGAGVWATQWIGDVHVRLIFVMVITPVFMDTFSFWVTDNFIKYNASTDTAKTALSPSQVLKASDQADADVNI